MKDGVPAGQAYEEVMNENPDLYTEYDTDNTKTLRSKEE